MKEINQTMSRAVAAHFEISHEGITTKTLIIIIIFILYITKKKIWDMSIEKGETYNKATTNK